MPNTLAHLGVQTIVSKSVCRSADFKWIAIGCILPDIPWILQRIMIGLVPGIDIMNLRLYAIIQASLFFSLILAGAISLLVRDSGRIFLLLAGNCLLHLLLDAMQIKWGNGVHLFAPFSWKLTAFQLFWPEQLPSILLTGLGLIVLLFFSIKDGSRLVWFTPSRNRSVAAAVLLSFYLLSPPLFFQGPLQADNHFLATVMDKGRRSGKNVAFDRCRYNSSTQTIRLLTGEELTVSGIPVTENSIISLQGKFTDVHTVQALAWHIHNRARDFSSWVGLGGILLLWMVALQTKRCRIFRPEEVSPTKKMNGPSL